MLINHNNKKTLLATALVAALSTASVGVFAAPRDNNGKAKGHVSLSDLSAGFIVKVKKGSALFESELSKDPAATSKAGDKLSKQLSKIAKKTDLTFVREMAMPGYYVFNTDVRMPKGQAKKLLRLLESHPDVEMVEVNQMLQPLATPNDSRYTEQWHYYEATGGLNAPLAWNNATGDGTVVAVLDTGYRPCQFA